MSSIHIAVPRYFQLPNLFLLRFPFLLCINNMLKTIDVIIVMVISMQNYKGNEVENVFPIFKVSRLVRVHITMAITK